MEECYLYHIYGSDISGQHVKNPYKSSPHNPTQGIRDLVMCGVYN